MSEMLNNVIIVAARISGLSNERELDRAEKDGVIKKKKTVEFVPGNFFSPIGALRSDLRRTMRTYAKRMNLMDAWLAPVGQEADIESAIKNFRRRLDDVKNHIEANYLAAVEAQCQADPARAADIRRVAPSTGTVLDSIRFDEGILRVPPEMAKGMGLEQELRPDSMAADVIAEIQTELEQSIGSGMRYINTGERSVRNVLHRVQTKAKGFGFLHPVIDAIPGAIDRVLQMMPPAGRFIEGDDALILGALIASIQNPRILDLGPVIASKPAPAPTPAIELPMVVSDGVPAEPSAEQAETIVADVAPTIHVEVPDAHDQIVTKQEEAIPVFDF